MGNFVTIRAFGDNFIYLYEYEGGNAAVVDPGDAGVVIREVHERGLNLKRILATHNHFDHIGGVLELKEKFGCEVIGGERITGGNRVFGDGDAICLGNKDVEIISTPGHTRGSVCYYQPGTGGEAGAVWTGDTLFINGCGRVMGGDMATMWKSLKKLSELPDETRIYCGHDYTIENYEFALMVEPDNAAVKERLEEVKRLQSEGCEVESTIGLEKKLNPFMRANDAEVFGKLRRRKDRF
jgi:hydroxyacylglutathione hydrolase